jgi:hemerythrin-like domain-containing protein
LGVLERILDAELSEGYPAAPEADAIADCILFFRLFTDACHHGQEEGVLFEELIDRGMPRTAGPIGVMLTEHEQGRAHVRTMTAALQRATQGESAAWAVLEQSGRDYISLLRRHIMKEDGVLFEMADRMITGPACQAVCDRYHMACLEKLEGRTKEELEQLAESLLGRYPPSSD